MTDTILRFEDVHKAFFGVTVLESITLEVDARQHRRAGR